MINYIGINYQKNKSHYKSTDFFLNKKSVILNRLEDKKVSLYLRKNEICLRLEKLIASLLMSHGTLECCALDQNIIYINGLLQNKCRNEKIEYEFLKLELCQ